MSIEASKRMLDSFRIDEDKMPAASAVFEVKATPFQAVSVGMLFMESVQRINHAHKMFLEGLQPSDVPDDDVELFFDRYGQASDHAAGADACRRLATNRPLLTYGELCCLAVICHIGIGLLPDSEDWADHVGEWLASVREQVLDDYRVRCEA